MKKPLISYTDVRDNDLISGYNPFVEDKNEKSHYFMLKWIEQLEDGDYEQHEEIYVRLTIDRHMDQHSWVAYNKSGEILCKDWSFGCYDDSWFCTIAEIITNCFHWGEDDHWTLDRNIFFAFVGEDIFNEMIRNN